MFLSKIFRVRDPLIGRWFVQGEGRTEQRIVGRYLRWAHDRLMEADWRLETALRLLERVLEIGIYQANPQPVVWLLNFGQETKERVWEMGLELEAVERLHFHDLWAPGYGEGFNRFPTEFLHLRSYWFHWGSFSGPPPRPSILCNPMLRLELPDGEEI